MQNNQKLKCNTYLKFRKSNQFKMENIFERIHDQPYADYSKVKNQSQC